MDYNELMTLSTFRSVVDDDISGVATGGLGGRVPPLVPRTDCGIRPDPIRW